MIRRLTVAALLLAAAGCSSPEPGPARPEAAPEDPAGLTLPAPVCESGALAPDALENTYLAPAGHDMAVEIFGEEGRYTLQGGHGGVSGGVYAVCGEQVCVREPGLPERCRPIMSKPNGSVWIGGTLLLPHRPEPRRAALTWIRTPTAAQILRVYPTTALEAGVRGSATLRCEMSGNGALRNCVIAGQSPPGQGFGEAALRLARYYRASPRYVQDQAEAPATIAVDFAPADQ